MYYAVSLLHMPGGETRKGVVVEIADGVVKDIYPFSGECQSMSHVYELFLSPCENACCKGDLDVEYGVAGVPLVAYSLCDDGRLVMLNG